MSGYTYSLVGGSSLSVTAMQSSSHLRAMGLSVPADVFCFGAGYQCMKRSNVPSFLMASERLIDQLVMTFSWSMLASAAKP